MSIPHIQYPLVDVRDAAEAHLKAVEIEEAKGKRFMGSFGVSRPHKTATTAPKAAAAPAAPAKKATKAKA